MFWKYLRKLKLLDPASLRTRSATSWMSCEDAGILRTHGLCEADAFLLPRSDADRCSEGRAPGPPPPAASRSCSL